MSKFNEDVKLEDTWGGLEQCYKEGLARAIGVSNWNNEQIARVLKSGTVPVHNSQVELHLYFPQHDHHEVSLFILLLQTVRQSSSLS